MLHREHYIGISNHYTIFEMYQRVKKPLHIFLFYFCLRQTLNPPPLNPRVHDSHSEYQYIIHLKILRNTEAI